MDEIGEDFFEAEYSPKSEFSKPKIVYEAMQKCIEARGKEMMKGFWNTKLTKDGFPIRTWVSDTRQVFIGCVIALNSILSPEIMAEEEYKKNIESYEKTIKKAKEKYSYEELERQNEKGKILWIGTGNKFLPEIGSMVVIQNITMRGFAEEKIGGWDNKVNLYWNIVLPEYDKMFACLNRLINKMNYFKAKISY